MKFLYLIHAAINLHSLTTYFSQDCGVTTSEATSDG